MADIGPIVTRCRADLSDMPVPLIERIAIETARMLCRDGRLWRATYRVTADDEGAYALPIPAGAVLHDIAQVAVDDAALEQSVASRHQPRWQRAGESVIVDAPQQPAHITVDAVLMPAIETREIPDVLTDEWVEALQHGILADALQKPGAWTNPDLGVYHRRLFSGWRAKARSTGRNRGVTARRRVIDPWARGQP